MSGENDIPTVEGPTITVPPEAVPTVDTLPEAEEGPRVNADAPSPSPVNPAAAEAFLCFVMIDLTTDQTPTALRPAQAFQAMIDACVEQVEGPFATAYGLTAISIRIATSPSDRKPNEIGINWRDSIPEAPGALAFHQVFNGIPDIELGASLFQTLTDGSGGQEAASGGFSHELLELLLDIGANQWAELQDGSGKMAAKEACDKVQNSGYAASNGVWVSNFLLPSYWIPGAPGPYDQMGIMSDRNDISHGYEIQADGPQNVSQVGGMRRHGVFLEGTLTPHQVARKKHPFCRTFRRGVRIP